MVFASFPCGPLALHLTAANARLRDRVAAVLDLFTARWEPPATAVELRVIEAEPPAAMARGTYLTCGRMHVDGDADALYATALSGASCRWAAGAPWTIAVPSGGPIPDDIEELLSLLLTTTWRQLGWVPLHAGAVVRDGCCALVTATSGGGKSTLVAALVRRGWQTLGDDKLLLRRAANGAGTVRALLHNFNLHPQVRGWFPEVGDLAARPVYSAWTEKRRVRAGEIWPGCERAAATPTHLVEVHRAPAGHGVRIEPLAAGEVLSSLLHQTVVPRDPATARPLLAAIAATAQDLRGVRATIASGAYSDGDCLAPLEAALAATSKLAHKQENRG